MCIGVIAAMIVCVISSAASGADTVESLVTRAHELKLYDSVYWHALIHYRKSSGGFKSEIDDPRFFISADGKYNPSGEIDATICMLFSDSDNKRSTRFIGRYDWLMRELKPDGIRNVTLDKEIERVIHEYDPVKMTVLFSDEYPGAIESAFGHVFIGVYPREGGDAKKIVLNYAGDMKKDPYYLVPFKGLFGGYQGKYSVQDYNRKVTGYGKNERRTVWEYDMNCTREEIERIVLHLHELDTIYCNFYFLDENCSQKLLSIIQPARPEEVFTPPFLYLAPIEMIEHLRSHGYIDSERSASIVYDPGVIGPVEPLLRHGYSKVSLTGGKANNVFFTGLSLLPLYNSMYDANPGMKPGFHLTALSSSLRYYQEDRKISLERATLFDLLVMNMSKSSGGCTKIRIEGNRFSAEAARPFAGNIRAGYGMFAYARDVGLGFANVGVDAYAFRLKSRERRMQCAAGSGVSVGASRDWLCVKTTVEAEGFYYAGKERRYIAKASCVNSINLSKYFTMHLKGYVSRIKDSTPYEVESGLDFYF